MSAFSATLATAEAFFVVWVYLPACPSFKELLNLLGMFQVAQFFNESEILKVLLSGKLCAMGTSQCYSNVFALNLQMYFRGKLPLFEIAPDFLVERMALCFQL